MAVLAGQSVKPSLGGIDNANLSDDLQDFALDWWPPHVTLSGASPAAIGLTRHVPVAANGTARPGQLSRCFEGDFYHRFHINPTSLELGNVVSTQSTPVRIWNAHLVPRTLLAIEGTDEGLLLTGQPSPPMLFTALKELTWQLNVTPDGQPVLDASVRWRFDDESTASVHVTANRIVAWSFAPDWGDSIVERLVAATDIEQSESGVEMRRALRLAPRREFEASMYAEGRERQLLDLALFGWGSRVWAMPIWPDIQLLQAPALAGTKRITCATQYLDFHGGGLAMLRSESAFEYEVVEVDSVDATGLNLARALQSTWPVRSRLYPARSAQLMEQPSLTRLTDEAQTAQVHFLVVEPCDWPEIAPSTLYRGWPVLDRRPDESEDLTSSYQRLQSLLDNGMSIPRNTDLSDRAFPLIGYRWLEMGRQERAAYRSLVYALRGQQKAWWIPTHANDLTLVALVTSVATTIDVAFLGYTRFAQAKPGRRDLRIELRDGAVLYRRIISSTELDLATERMVIDQAFGREIQPAQVARICWMSLCRANSDTVEIEHITDSDGPASSSLVFKGVLDDEF